MGNIADVSTLWSLAFNWAHLASPYYSVTSCSAVGLMLCFCYFRGILRVK